MRKPILVVMAAGLGSRFGGIKQIEPLDEKGRAIIDFSIYDAVAAGFEEAIFIIKPEMEEAFRETIGKRIEGSIKYRFVYQVLEDIPEGYSIRRDV